MNHMHLENPDIRKWKIFSINRKFPLGINHELGSYKFYSQFYPLVKWSNNYWVIGIHIETVTIKGSPNISRCPSKMNPNIVLEIDQMSKAHFKKYYFIHFCVKKIFFIFKNKWYFENVFWFVRELACDQYVANRQKLDVKLYNLHRALSAPAV